MMIVLAELMQLVSLVAWTTGGAWAGGRLAGMAIDLGYPALGSNENVLTAGHVVGGVVGFALSATAAAVVFAFAQIELNTRDIARYYVERRKTEAAIERAMK
jgi:hypothetical protein